MNKDTQKKMEALSGLYSLTKTDWDLTVHQCLTEPTCATAVIAPERTSPTRYRVDADTIDEAIAGAIELCYQEQILGKKIEPVCPFTNPDDHNDTIPIPE